MKFLTLKNFIAATILVAIAALFVLSTSTFGADEIKPSFNAFTNVQGQGDERDFVRVRNPGTNQPFANSVNNACDDGQEVSIQVYIHNSASQGYNGPNLDGPTVAKDTKLSLTKSGKNINGEITASNAATVNDSAQVTCNGEVVDFEFIPGSGLQTNSQGNVPLSNNLFTPEGTLVGFSGANGIIPACWEYVTVVYAKVVIKKPEEPVVKKECVIADVKKLTRTRYQITANAEVQNATVTSYVFTTKNSAGTVVDSQTFNTSALSQSYEVEQTEPGTYKVQTVINTNKGQADGTCETEFTVKPESKNPEYSCDMFKLTLKDRTATVSFTPNASNGAEFKDATVKFDADGKTIETTTTNKVVDGKVTASYTYPAGSTNIQTNATVRFTVTNGDKVEVKEVKCSDKAVLGTTTPTPPTTLPDTGAGSMIAGIFVAIAALGTFAHRKFTLNR
jgi:hypothetical protein